MKVHTFITAFENVKMGEAAELFDIYELQC